MDFYFDTPVESQLKRLKNWLQIIVCDKMAVMNVKNVLYL